MKLTKKLFPAIGMLLLSACMLVTSTFAWFSMNENVTATGMNVVAKGDQVYLQIINPNNTKDGYSNAFINGSAQVDAYGNSTGLELLPTNVKANNTDFAAYEEGSTFVWATAIGKAPGQNYVDNNGANQTDGYAPVNGQYTEAPHSEETPYYLENTFSIRLDPTAGAASAAGPLRVSTVSFTSDVNHTDDFAKTVCVFVVCGDYAQLYSYETGAFTKVAGDDYLAATEIEVAGEGGATTKKNVFKDTTGVEVTIYVFFNGDNPNCTLEKLAAANTSSLNTYSVDVSFTVA